MNSALSSIPVPRRRHLAATLGLFAVLFVAVGAVAATGGSAATLRVFSILALLVAVVLGLMAWGVAHSVKLDVAEQRLDAAIEDALAGTDLACRCGHHHDPSELHVTDAAAYAHGNGGDCFHDGRGADCEHSCQSCVLASMRPSPNRSRAERLAQ